jgi:hypothetical protein
MVRGGENVTISKVNAAAPSRSAKGQRAQLASVAAQSALALLALLCLTAAANRAHAQATSISAWDAADFRSWSFIPNWTSQTQINGFRTDGVYDHVSDVLYSFGVQPRADGSLFYTSASTNQLARLKSDQELYDFRYHMCMFTVNGGSTDSVWESIVNNPSTRATFTQNVKNLMLANNMTGFNLDWERPNTVSEWGNYTQLAKEMQAAFPAAWEVSVDDYGSADSRWNDSALFDPSAFDQVGLMAYHYAASSQNTWLNQHTALGFSDSQMIIGMGTWGQGGPATLPLKNLVAADPNLPADATNWTGTAVDVNGVTRTGTWDIVSRYEVRDNVQLALNRGLAGVMWWTLSYDATNKFSLERVAQHYAMVKRNVPDLNLDGKVNAADANVLANNMGASLTNTGTATAAQFESFYMNGNWEKGDHDGNGFVNQADADWLASRYAALGVAIPDRLPFSGTFENFFGSVGINGRWKAGRDRTNHLVETGNFTQRGAGELLFAGSGVGAAKHSATSVVIRNQNAAELSAGLNSLPRTMNAELSTPINLGDHSETYITFMVRQNTAGLSTAQLASPNRSLALELKSSGQTQYDFAFLGPQAAFAIRSQQDVNGEDVSANGFAADTTYLFVAKLSGNGLEANTLQASLFAVGSFVGNFTDPNFQWMLTAHGSAGFDPIITQLQLTSAAEGSFTVSNLWVGSAAEFFTSQGVGDFNGDGVVNAADLARWQSNLGMIGATAWQGDANGDGMVDGLDLLIWQRMLGAATPMTTAVPEPSTIACLAAIFVTAVFNRRVK